MEINKETSIKLLGWDLKCPKCGNYPNFEGDTEYGPDFDGYFIHEYKFSCFNCSPMLSFTISAVEKKECIPFEKIKDLKKKKRRWFNGDK